MIEMTEMKYFPSTAKMPQTAVLHFRFSWIAKFPLAALLAACVIVGGPASAQSRNKNRPQPKPAKIRLPESVREETDVDMQVVAVASSTRGKTISAARQIDSLIESKLLSMDVYPGDIASDEVFLRRVYLDVAGRIPTLEEATEFLDSKDSAKRENLIDQLLSSPGYVSNFYNFWADTLRIVDRPQPNLIADPFAAYVKDSLRTNRPYDKWVYEMLTADGKIWKNPAVGYQLRDDGMKLPYIDNTVRVFLGTQIGCAQCHDHPFDRWTQHEFYQLAAYTHGTRTRIVRGMPGFEKGNPANALINEAKTKFDKGRVPGSFQRIARANTYYVSESPAKLRLPHDYAYDDAKPKEIVEPAVLWGEIPSWAADSSMREQFAAWLTSPDNELFSKVIANRLWYRIMGVGIVEPIDNFSDDYPPSNRELLEFLASEMVREGFDMKQFVRTILYSKSYQRDAVDYDITSGETFYFPGPAVRRMTAEQVWDSLLTLAVENPWPFQRPTAKDYDDIVDLDFSKETYDSVLRKSKEFEKSLFRGPYMRSLNKHSYQGNVLCRASELPSPVPADHFLRQFGQSDREVINGDQQEATVPQILAMFNGPITHVMLEPGSAAVNDVVPIQSNRERIDAIFMSVLTRQPNPTDRRIAARELGSAENVGVGMGNILWALLNTREFLFIQ